MVGVKKGGGEGGGGLGCVVSITEKQYEVDQTEGKSITGDDLLILYF